MFQNMLSTFVLKSLDKIHILCDFQCVEQGLRQEIHRAKSVASRKALLLNFSAQKLLLCSILVNVGHPAVDQRS